jgi:hypothetical protein
LIDKKYEVIGCGKRQEHTSCPSLNTPSNVPKYYFVATHSLCKPMKITEFSCMQLKFYFSVVLIRYSAPVAKSWIKLASRIREEDEREVNERREKKDKKKKKKKKEINT